VAVFLFGERRDWLIILESGLINIESRFDYVGKCGKEIRLVLAFSVHMSEEGPLKVIR